MKRKTKRLAAFSLAVVLGVASVTGYGGFTGKGMAVSEAAAAENVSYVFEEGYGTGNSFNAEHWDFGGQYLDSSNGETPLDDADKSAIVNDTEYLNEGDVIRLIRGVKASNSNPYLEDSSSYNTYRTGRASLNAGDIFLDQDADFSVKFTFSMPEAVVNTTQTGGDQFAREVGGDGIAFVMTTESGQLAHAGSGIGYQGMRDSIAIELDSFFNGVYYFPETPGVNDYPNWDFDNQLYLHDAINVDDGTKNYGSNIGQEYGNYVNPNHNERFDHIALTVDGAARTHKAIYYINNLDPTKLVGNQYVNLANRYDMDGNIRNTGSIGTDEERSSSTCDTRFADAGVNDRLFTVWVDYDGNTDEMNISYANGDYVNAVKPDTPQITTTIDLADKFGEQQIYMGFTSAVASSKANHTIHSFYFSNNLASYKLNYYLKQADGSYSLIKESEIATGKVGSTVTANDSDSDYENAYSDDGYVYNGNYKDTKTSVKLEEAGKTYEMNVYYDPVSSKVPYKIIYHKWDSDKNDYVTVDEDTYDGEGDEDETYKLDDIDPDYETKYPGFEVTTETGSKYEVTLDPDDDNTMHVYYKPVPVQQAKYKINYYTLNPDTGEYDLKYSAPEQVGNVGNSYKVEDVDPTYVYRYSGEGYIVNAAKDDTYTVTLKEADKTYEMNVYYDPQKTTYKTEYYLKQADGTYKLADTVPGEETYVGKPVMAVEKEYSGYTHVQNEYSHEHDTVEADGSTTLKVYYDPYPVETPAYRLNYYKLDPNTGEYKYITSTGWEVGTLNEVITIKEVDPDYEENFRSDGYELNEEKNGDWSVTLIDSDGTYEMNVYYDPKKVPYKTNYYVKQPDGTYELKESVPGEDTDVGTNVKAEIKTYDGYQHVTISETLEEATVSTDGTTTLKVYYDPVPNPTYTVEYYVQQPDGTYQLYQAPATLEGKTGETVTADIISIDGYVHTTTQDTLERETVASDGSTVLRVYYNLVPNPTYTVEYYVQQPDGTYTLYQEPTTLEGKTGETVTADIISIDGYVHTTTQDTLETSTVASDGSTVLKVYYNLEPTVEPTTEPTTEPEETEEPDEEDEEETPKANKPKTGDETNITFLVIVLTAAGTVGGICLYFRKKEDE